MMIVLTREQQEWLEAEVAAGRFTSVEEGVRVAVAELMRPIETDDLSWAKPYLDEARAEFGRGDGLTLEEFNAHVERRLKQLR